MVDIVRLTSANAALLDTLAPEVFDHAVHAPFLAAFLSDPRHVMFVAVDDGVVIGMASAVEYFHPDKAPQLFINEVGVSPAYQRRGIGRALTEALVREAKARGCIYAWLGTASDNAAGQACFAAVPEGDPPETFVLYAWDLED
jgi:aminoglycoside 6'-N-acetyltransferase I